MFPALSDAAIDISSGFWSTTYNCAAQKQGDAMWLTCDGLQKYGDWKASTGEGEQITPLANMSTGGGGSGQRHWIGNGKNNNSGSVEFCLTTTEPEIWFRFYTRWEAGFYMTNQKAQKLVYSRAPTTSPYIDTQGDDGIRMVQNGNAAAIGTSGVWKSIMGGSMSDGKWHEFQFHLKAAGSNGGGDVWVDGKHVLSFTGYDWGSTTGWQCFAYPENLDFNPAGTMYQDVDDLAISTKGYIPSLNVPTAAPPAAPTNFKVQ